jgi:four helix bundle protein
MATRIRSHHELEVYKKAFESAMNVFHVTRRLPREEMHSLIDQVRRSSRSVNANITEAWRKRRYEAHFISKLSDAETEAAETQTWLEFAVHCGYLEPDAAKVLYRAYNEVISMLVAMINRPESWLLPIKPRRPRAR